LDIKNLKFIGIDPSYNGFGLIILDIKANIIEEKLLKSLSCDEIEDRIIKLEQDFKFISDIKDLYIVYIEGLSYSSRGLFTLQMGALNYFIRIFCRKNKINYKIISPNELKRFVTGKGQCKKELILLKTYKKWGIEFYDNNLADAYGLARMAIEDFKGNKK
jgi:crossover junction endodeoxyribonuclease RuvC